MLLINTEKKNNENIVKRIYLFYIKIYMNESSLLFCNINELKFQKKTKNTCNTLYLQRNSCSRKKIENSRKHILLDILTIYQNKIFNKQIYTLIFHYM